MPAERKTLLCVRPSTPQKTLIKRIAIQHALEFVSCSTEDDALQHLEEGKPYRVMVMANLLEEGGHFRVIESARLSLQHVTLPIAFMMGVRDLGLAHSAMSSGVTEIFLSSEQDSLAAFIGDCSKTAEEGHFGGNILLVEDSVTQASYIKHLCNALGMSIDHVEDVESAEILLSKNLYQIILVDIVLKGTKSGISLVKKIRQNPLVKQPILVMSAFDDLPRQLLALKSGADDFIRKPFSPEEFIWRIKKIMQCYAGQNFDVKTPAIQAKKCAKRDFSDLLSPRESEICTKILAGTSDREIASTLGISFWTVRSHIQQIFTKTGALNRRELMARFFSASGNRD